jgi:hypothetical protein
MRKNKKIERFQRFNLNWNRSEEPKAGIAKSIPAFLSFRAY